MKSSTTKPKKRKNYQAVHMIGCFGIKKVPTRNQKSSFSITRNQTFISRSPRLFPKFSSAKSSDTENQVEDESFKGNYNRQNLLYQFELLIDTPGKKNISSITEEGLGISGEFFTEPVIVLPKQVFRWKLDLTKPILIDNFALAALITPHPRKFSHNQHYRCGTVWDWSGIYPT